MKRGPMMWVSGAIAAAALFHGAAMAEPLRASGPFVHENLAVFFIHGENARGDAPLTLQEAMKEGVVQVHETGDIHELKMENHGDREVFVQSGDIVKGGKQDRVVASSLVVPERSGSVPIASFSVEEGRRWQRGVESETSFTGTEFLIPSRQAKLAMKPDLPVQVAGMVEINGATRSTRQHQMWRSVAATQQSLRDTVGRSVTETVSRGSLPLSLENATLKERQSRYVKALDRLPQDETIIGYAFAVNGRLNSADVYASQALFRKLWPKLLRASATEAIAESGRLGDAAPTPDAVVAFLTDIEAAPRKVRSLTSDVRLETSETEQTVYSEAQRSAGHAVHRSYVAK